MKTRTKPQRTMQFLPNARLLFLKIGKKTDAYFLWVESDTIELQKALDNTSYTVVNGHCNCKGHTQHGHCKHVDAIAKLRQLGKLETPEPEPQAAKVQPAKKAPTPKYAPIPGREEACIYGPCRDENIDGFCAP